MVNETTVTLQGWVGSDVVLRRAGETPVASFRVGCTPRRRQQATGEWVDGDTQWYAVSAWRWLGEHCAASLRKGDPVVVQGRLSSRRYVTKTGVEVTSYDVDAVLVGHDLTRGTTVFTKAERAVAAA